MTHRDAAEIISTLHTIMFILAVIAGLLVSIALRTK